MPTEQHKITIRDIARACHASTATVSRALNGKAGVSERLRSLIHEYAERHDYHPNGNARSMRLGRSSLAMLIVREELLDASIIPIRSIELIRKHFGLEVQVVNIPYGEDLIDGLKEAEATYRPALFLLSGPCLVVDESRFRQIHTSMMFILCDDAPSGYPSVMSDDRVGAKAVTESLQAAGHREIMAITESRPNGEPYYRERIKGFKDALALNGTDFNPSYVIALPIDYGNYLHSSIAAVGKHIIPLLKSQSVSFTKPTAIVVFSDFLAFAINKALYDGGIQVPGDISMASFGGWDITNFLPAPVRSWVQPVPDILETSIVALSTLLRGQPFSGDIPLHTPRPDGTVASATAVSPTCFVVPGYLRPGQSVKNLRSTSLATTR